VTPLGTSLVDWSSLGQIVLVSLAGGAGLAIAFGVLLLGLSRAGSARGRASRIGDLALTALAAAFCIGAVVLALYAITKKPSSSTSKKTAVVRQLTE
jgi:hypothetical protein